MNPFGPQTVPVPPPNRGGRSGVAGSETPSQHDSKAEVAEQLADMVRTFGQMRGLLLDALDSQVVRANSHRVEGIDTNVAGEIWFDLPTIFGGEPGLNVRIITVGGAGTSFQVNINGGGWLPVLADTLFDQETIFRCGFRTLTPGAGSAVIRFGARIGKE